MRDINMLRRSSMFAAEVMEVFDRTPTEKELVSQSKALCREFIYSRLVREGLSWSKIEPDLPPPSGLLGDVSMVLLKLGDELEYIRPYLFRNVAKQLNISVAVETMVSDAFLTVTTEILSLGVTWGKVVAIFAIAGGLAVDCVRQGHPAMVHTIVDSLGELVRKSLVPWLKRRGGWEDISKCVVNTDTSAHSHWITAVLSTWRQFVKTMYIYLTK
ncbi:bcl-2-related ovarian killer protein homolog B [Chanos chanos]|uniref:Bcl-2-related ovarian killer protein homolog B n=1 Tax=Chanos chanos TaxID=29144 RepID=A0A6J2VFL9_CHACN|nr:bcl-2-related ovarian killer protein homolog B-like [Chanos chanos]